MNEYITEHKGYQVKPHKEHPTCYIVVTAGKGGKIPDCLIGMFTTRVLAKNEIDKYVETKPVKDKSNAETLTTSGSK